MMSFDYAIKVENIGKCYQIYDKPIDRLKQMLSRKDHKYYREFWALRNISFEVKKGETVGIVGKNGSGKSTLLQIICGTLNPTSGEVTTKGRIAALLELGSGFNPEFSGRDNVYMNAALLGLSKAEIDEKFESIIDFADIGPFIDQPVKTYSSGMMVRLAFAVQAQIEPDILIVDEALAVGDAKFQARCFERLKQLKQSGTSILLVTHSTEQIVTHCSKAVLIDSGVVMDIGEPRQVTNYYLDLLFGRSVKSKAKQNQPLETVQNVCSDDVVTLNQSEDVFLGRPNSNSLSYRWGDRKAIILDYILSCEGINYPPALRSGSNIELSMSVRFIEEIFRPIIGFTVKNKEGVTVYGTNSELLEFEDVMSTGSKGSVEIINMSFTCNLAPGDYFISLGIASKASEDVEPHDRRYDAIHIQVEPDKTMFGLSNMNLKMNKLSGDE
ncbi:TPA: ABC transporter ATP-binding protein [Citrobacter braakii]|nr:ABC transporter ATP-binding protein [Citrobacter braakii]MBJ9046413.1 ABC transporter ATP-binding protein [Citrobacter braakii]MBJ9587411.1 ABC transporter ATP-binding protein [Citrobacter braakii]HCB1743752.1 ABC transporter ATP-binding protein [Citrobacter braakii]HDT2307438.1 ABC transporter ATP-binding protein [Citrobacter braakii]